jgi:hypothetical protein
LAVTLHGTVLVNVAALGPTSARGIAASLRRARASGNAVFVGLALDAKEARTVQARLDDAAAEAIARVLAARAIKGKRR